MEFLVCMGKVIYVSFLVDDFVINVVFDVVIVVVCCCFGVSWLSYVGGCVCLGCDFVGGYIDSVSFIEMGMLVVWVVSVMVEDVCDVVVVVWVVFLLWSWMFWEECVVFL